MKFIFQYAYGNDNRIALSDWIEKTKIIEADNLKDAVKKGNKSVEHLGTWDVRDCYPASNYDLKLCVCLNEKF